MQAISNRQLTLLRKLQQKKYRQKEQLFLVEGKRAVKQVADNGRLEIRHLFFDKGQGLWEMEEWSGRAEGIPAAAVESVDFLEVTDTETPQGVLALCAIPQPAELNTMAAREGIIIALDRIRDPGNLGSMVRTSAWFGAAGMLLGKGTVDLFHPKVVRTTAGSTGTVPYRTSDLAEDLDKLEREGRSIVLLDAGPDSTPLREVAPDGKSVLVVGNEAHGISRSLFGKARKTVRIEPGAARQRTPVESLNAAIAMAIAIYTLGGSTGS